MGMPTFGYGGYPQQMAPVLGAPPKQAGGMPAKKRYPCYNCRIVMHWKSNPVCPNFHLFLQLQAAKAEEMRKGQSPADWRRQQEERRRQRETDQVRFYNLF